MNNVNLMGRFTKDPTVRYTTGDKPLAIANFTLAVQDDYDKEKADFVSCKAFGKTAEIIEKYCHKGDFIGVNGKISTGSYEKDGKKVYTTDIVVNLLTFTPKVVKQEDAQESAQDVPATTPEGFEKLEDDDIPF